MTRVNKIHILDVGSLIETGLSADIEAGTGVFDAEGRLVGITSSDKTREGNAHLAAGIIFGGDSNFFALARAQLFFQFLLKSLSKSQAEEALLQNDCLVWTWLKEAKIDDGTPVYKTISAIGDEYMREEWDKPGDAGEYEKRARLEKFRDRFLRETLASMRQTTGQNESDMVSLSCEVHYPWDWRGYLVIVTFSERDNTVTWQGRPVQTVRLTRSDIVALIPQGDESKDSRELHVSRQSGKFSLFSDILVSSGVCEEPGTNPLF